MVSNFYHIKEKNVFLENEIDSIEKHKRNLVLAIWTIATAIFFPLGLPRLCAEIHRELCIREINKIYPTMPYNKCVTLVNMRGNNGVIHEGKMVKNPIKINDELQRRRFRITKFAADASLVALVLIGIIGAIIIGI